LAIKDILPKPPPSAEINTSASIASAPVTYHLAIERSRGIKALSWHPIGGVNVILDGGDIGKTTILDAIALLLSPTNPSTLSDTDYYARDDGAADTGKLQRNLSTRGMVSSHRSVVPLSHSLAPGGPLSCIAPHMDLRVGASCTPGMQ
jgi:hypothetical protein